MVFSASVVRGVGDPRRESPLILEITREDREDVVE